MRKYNLTTIDQREAFAAELLRNGGLIKEAAESVGITVDAGRRLIANPRVATILQSGLQRIKIESGIIGYNVAREIAQSEKAPAGARMVAARTLLEIAGMIGKGQDQAAAKDPSEMSLDELHGLIDRLDKELGDRAKPVNISAPQDSDAQLAEMIS